jgi:hypothetical protein
MMAPKLNAHCSQVTIKNLQNMHEKPLPPTGARMGLSGVSGLGPPARQGTTHGWTERPPRPGLVGWRMSRW